MEQYGYTNINTVGLPDASIEYIKNKQVKYYVCRGCPKYFTYFLQIKSTLWKWSSTYGWIRYPKEKVVFT